MEHVGHQVHVAAPASSARVLAKGALECKPQQQVLEVVNGVQVVAISHARHFLQIAVVSVKTEKKNQLI